LPRPFARREGLTNAFSRPAYEEHGGPVTGKMPGQYKTKAGGAAGHDDSATIPSILCVCSCGHERISDGKVTG
jgi:hypothetical protein